MFRNINTSRKKEKKNQKNTIFFLFYSNQENISHDI